MTSRSWLRFAVLVVAALVVQVAVLDEIVVLDAHPDVMVIIPAAAGLIAGAERGAIFGFITGLVADLVVPLPFGMSALTYVFVGFGLGLARALPGWADLRAGAYVVSALGAGAGVLFYAILGSVLGQPGMADSSLVSVFFVVVAGAVVLAPAVLWSIRWVLAGASGSAARASVPSGGSATA